MKKLIYHICFVFTVLCLTVTESKAQSFSDKLFYGGNIGFAFESDYWMFNVSPLVGYHITPSLSSGLSLLYAHESYKKRNPDYNINSYGGGVFLRYDLGPTLMADLPFSIFFQGDYEGRQEDVKFKKNTSPVSYNDFSRFQNRLYLGAGFNQHFGGRTSAFIMVSVDVLQMGKGNSVQPLIRTGIIF